MNSLNFLNILIERGLGQMSGSSFSCKIQTMLHFGKETLKNVGNDVLGLGTNALVVAQERMRELGYLQQVTCLLEKAGVKTSYWTKVIENPIYTDVDDAAKFVQSEGIDIIVALGGGSTIDVAKGISVVASTGGSAWDYVYSVAKKTVGVTLPVVAIPTTSGTGSHMTKYAVLTNPEQGVKSTIVSEKIFPRLAIVDPILMVSLDPHLTAITGFDALSHVVESYVNVNANRMTDMMCEEAIKTITKTLPKTVKDIRNISLREDLAWADTLAGLCISFAGTTLPHAIGQPISGRYGHIRHGETLAATYPSFVKFSYPGNPVKFNNIVNWLAQGIGYSPGTLSANVSRDVFIEFQKAIGLNIRLKDFGLGLNDVLNVLDAAVDCPDVYTNPVVASREEIIQLYQESI